MGERIRCLGLLVALLGCGETVTTSEAFFRGGGSAGDAGTGPGGSGQSGHGSGASASGNGGQETGGGPSVDPRTFTWTDCGTIPSTPSGYRHAQYLPDGSAVVVYEPDGSIALWSLADNEKTRELRPPGDQSGFAISFDGTLVVEGGPSPSIRRFDDGSLVRALAEAPPECRDASYENGIAFLSDRYIGVRGNDAFCLWEVADGSLTAVLPASTPGVVDDDALVGWTGAELVRYDFAGEERQRIPIDPLFGEIGSASEVFGMLSPGGTYLATTAQAAGGRTACALWDTVDGSLLWSGDVETTSFDTGSIAFSPCGEAVSLCNSVRRADGALLHAVPSQRNGFVFPNSLSPDGASGIASDPWESMVGVVDLETGRVDVLGGVPVSADGPMMSLAVSADGRTLASAGDAVLAWDVAPEFEKSRARYFFSTARERPRVEISPDGRWIAVSGDGRVVVSPSGELQNPPYPLRSDPCWPLELQFSPDGKWAAGAGLSDSIEVFRLSAVEGTGQMDIAQNLFADCTRSSEAPIRFSERIAFTADGEFLETETGKRYRTSDWRLAREGSGSPLPHFMKGSLELSPTGERILSDCSSLGHCGPYPVAFPKFSPDGYWVIAGGILYGKDENRVLDADAVVGTFAPNGDAIVAHADNSITRYCRSVE